MLTLLFVERAGVFLAKNTRFIALGIFIRLTMVWHRLLRFASARSARFCSLCSLPLAPQPPPTINNLILFPAIKPGVFR